MPSWKPHLYRVGTDFEQLDEAPEDPEAHRKRIEPWLSAVFQSEHLSLHVGNGLSLGLASVSGANAPSMNKVKSEILDDVITKAAEEWAKRCAGRAANLEDQIRVALGLLEGLQTLGDDRQAQLRSAIEEVFQMLLKQILELERHLFTEIETRSEKGTTAEQMLSAFILSFASRTASRERLHLFTTNYDRILEYGSDLLGLRTIDRFVGTLRPVFRSSRMDVDLHYNPPGIRGEPRFLEGVVRFAKLHGSIDWVATKSGIVRAGIPFGAAASHPDLPTDAVKGLLIYPNPVKDMETVAYPYAELFRDFSAAICRPNSVLVTYGYGFGDEHINHIIEDALTIPSTHLVIISYCDASGRIPAFCNRVGRDAQISLLLGSHFGSLENLVQYYLPKPAIDLISARRAEVVKRRLVPAEQPSEGTGGTP